MADSGMDKRGRVRGPMKEPDRTILKNNIPELLKIITEPNLILESLCSKGVFDGVDKEKVERETTAHGNQAGVTKLLNLLQGCGSDALQLFKPCLIENKYAFTLEPGVNNRRGRVRGPMKEPDRTILKKNIPKLVQIITEPNLILESLCAKDVFDGADREKVERRTREHDNGPGVTELLNILLNCGSDALQLFGSCLKENNYNEALELLGFNTPSRGSSSAATIVTETNSAASSRRSLSDGTGPSKPNKHVVKGVSLYKMNHRKRGRAIIINNVNFQPNSRLSQRVGSKKDVCALGVCLSKLKFDVQEHEDKTLEEITDILKKAGEDDHTDEDCIVVSVMSHGGIKGICATDCNYEQSTGLLTQNDIVEPFRGHKCKTLVGKPKIFILNACQGDEKDYGVTVRDSNVRDNVCADSTGPLHTVHTIPNQADLFVCFSCSEGFESFRKEDLGSHFIQDLSRVFTDHHQTLHLGELIVKVKQLVADRQSTVHGNPRIQFQMPVVHDSLRKLVYFN